MNTMTSADSEFLKNLFNAIPSPVFVVDSDMRIIHFNSAASEILYETSVHVLMKKAEMPWNVLMPGSHLKAAGGRRPVKIVC